MSNIKRSDQNFKYKNRNVSVILTRKYRENTEEKAPVFWRITFNRKLKHYFSGFEFTDIEWDEFVNRDLRKHKIIKQTLHRFLNLTLTNYIEKLIETNDFSFEALDALLKNHTTISVNEAFERKIESLDMEYSIGNATIYRTTQNALKRFKYYQTLRNRKEKEEFIQTCTKNKYKSKGKNKLDIQVNIQFEELTPRFFNECETFWRETEITDSTIGLYMRTIRALINNKEGETPYISEKHYPFGTKRGKYIIPEGGRREISLSIEDIWRIEDFETDHPQLLLAKDIFAFMFYCNGLNFGDLCRLRYENIDAPSGEIVFQRKKTLRKGEKPTFIYAPMLPPMVEIINRQGNKEQDGFIFPFLNGIEPTIQNERNIIRQINFALEPINSSLKQIATALELDPNISTSYTRNSYISHLVSEMFVNPIIVRKMVGHSTKKDVTAGYVNLTAKKRLEINLKLLNPEKRYAVINSGRVI
ncbi:MAG: phage integrase SAM-like domain-containing protein [Bacteroidota bacterium]|nr:phage integrase SAM-like domain-containing protein [Dysgonamonadaceae bacterium]